MPRGQISPSPPLAEGAGLPWDVAVGDAVEVVARARAQLGDTFEMRSGTDTYLFTFSPTGVDSFYALPEEQASKGLADYLMLKRKLPEEIFDGRRLFPADLFRRDDVASYLANLDHALDRTVEELGETGTLDVFALTRRLAHRMGLASWAGPGSADGEAFERLAAALDVLDGSDAFVHPDAMAAVAASGKKVERAALAEVVEVVWEAVLRYDAEGVKAADGERQELFGRIVGAWDGEPDEVRRTGIGHDVALIHIASMSNLASALGWAIIDLVEHPEVQAQVLAGGPESVESRDLASRCSLESTRLAQRSIMSRAVMSPVEFDAGDATYSVPAGMTIATLLPLLNTSAGPGLETWDPDRWKRHRLADTSTLATPTLVTAFGHGKHRCPAQPFSLAAMTAATTGLLGHYDLTPGWTSYPTPVPAQIGGVARAGVPCPAAYRKRAS